MGLSIKEGLSLAEREAWRSHGKQHRFLFTYGKRLIVPGLIVFVLGTLGGGAYWAWGKLHDALGGANVKVPSAPHHGGPIALWVWLAYAVLALITLAVIRGRSEHARSLGVLALQIAPVAIAWLVLIGYTLNRIT